MLEKVRLIFLTDFLDIGEIKDFTRDWQRLGMSVRKHILILRDQRVLANCSRNTKRRKMLLRVPTNVVECFIYTEHLSIVFVSFSRNGMYFRKTRLFSE